MLFNFVTHLHGQRVLHRGHPPTLVTVRIEHLLITTFIALLSLKSNSITQIALHEKLHLVVLHEKLHPNVFQDFFPNRGWGTHDVAGVAL